MVYVIFNTLIIFSSLLPAVLIVSRISFIGQIHRFIERETIVSCNENCSNYNEFMMAWLHRRRAYKLSILCVTTFMTGNYCSRKKKETKIIQQTGIQRLRFKLC